MKIKRFYCVELACCNRPWGLFDTKKEAAHQAASLRRTHKGYYAWSAKTGRPYHVTLVTIELREYYATPSGYAQV